MIMTMIYRVHNGGFAKKQLMNTNKYGQLYKQISPSSVKC